MLPLLSLISSLNTPFLPANQLHRSIFGLKSCRCQAPGEIDPSLSCLFQPLTIGQLRLKNRIIMAPLTRGRADKDRVPNELMAEYYKQRSGAGLIISEATTISEEGSGWIHYPGIYTDRMEVAWRRVTDAVHEADGLIFLQLWHQGRTTHSYYLGGKPPVAPSAIKMNGEGVRTSMGRIPHEVPRPLETSEIPRVVGSAVNARKLHI
jgi:N-ethylmaleimide reductase